MSVYADVEKLLYRYLQAAFPEADVAAESPADLIGRLPAVRIMRIGGGDRAVSLDVASVDVDCFAATRPEANDFAGQIRTALTRGAVGYFNPDLSVSISALTVQNFGWRPYSNTNVRSVGMTADVTVHNHQ